MSLWCSNGVIDGDARLCSEAKLHRIWSSKAEKDLNLDRIIDPYCPNPRNTNPAQPRCYIYTPKGHICIYSSVLRVVGGDTCTG